MLPIQSQTNLILYPIQREKLGKLHLSQLLNWKEVTERQPDKKRGGSRLARYMKWYQDSRKRGS